MAHAQKATLADGSMINPNEDPEQDDRRENAPRHQAALPREAHHETELRKDPQAKRVDKDRHHLQGRNEHHPKQGKARQANLTDQLVSTT